MEYLLFVIIPILSPIKVFLQSFVVRKKGNTLASNILINAIIVFFSFAVFAAIFFKDFIGFFTDFNSTLLIYALIFGVSTAVFQVTYSLAFRYGPVSISSIIISYAIIVQILVGFFGFNEKITICNWISMIPRIVSIPLFAKPETSGKKANWKWLIFITLAFLGNTALCVASQVFPYEAPEIANRANSFMMVGYLISAIILFIAYPCFRKKGEALPKFDWRDWIFMIIAGAAIIIHNYLTIIAYTYFPAVIFVPIRSSVGLIVMVVADLIIYKEKPSKKTLIGIALALIATILSALPW